MAAKKHARRAPNRSATRRGPSGREHPPPEVAPFLLAIREDLRGDDRLAVVRQVLRILDGCERPDGPHPSLLAVIEGPASVDIAESTAFLHLVSALSDEPAAVEAARTALASRHQPMPPMIRDLGQVRVDTAYHFGDAQAEAIFLGMVWPDGARASLATLASPRPRAAISRALPVDREPEALVAQLAATVATSRTPRIVTRDLADARTLLLESIAAREIATDDDEVDWPLGRHLLEALLRTMPEGGRSYAELPDDEPPDGPVPDEDADALEVAAMLEGVADFYASDAAAEIPRDGAHEEAVGAIAMHTLVDDWTWNEDLAEHLLAECLPWDDQLAQEAAEAVPDVVPACFEWGLERHGAPEAERRRTRAAVGLWLEEYRRIIALPDVVAARAAAQRYAALAGTAFAAPDPEPGPGPDVSP